MFKQQLGSYPKSWLQRQIDAVSQQSTALNSDLSKTQRDQRQITDELERAKHDLAPIKSRYESRKQQILAQQQLADSMAQETERMRSQASDLSSQMARLATSSQPVPQRPVRSTMPVVDVEIEELERAIAKQEAFVASLRSPRPVFGAASGGGWEATRLQEMKQKLEDLKRQRAANPKDSTVARQEAISHYTGKIAACEQALARINQTFASFKRIETIGGARYGVNPDGSKDPIPNLEQEQQALTASLEQAQQQLAAVRSMPSQYTPERTADSSSASASYKQRELQRQLAQQNQAVDDQEARHYIKKRAVERLLEEQAEDEKKISGLEALIRDLTNKLEEEKIKADIFNEDSTNFQPELQNLQSQLARSPFDDLEITTLNQMADVELGQRPVTPPPVIYQHTISQLAEEEMSHLKNMATDVNGLFNSVTQKVGAMFDPVGNLLKSYPAPGLGFLMDQIGKVEDNITRPSDEN